MNPPETSCVGITFDLGVHTISQEFSQMFFFSFLSVCDQPHTTRSSSLTT